MKYPDWFSKNKDTIFANVYINGARSRQEDVSVLDRWLREAYVVGMIQGRVDALDGVAETAAGEDL